MVFCGTFDAKGSKIDVTPDGLHITQSGQIPKLVTQVEKITFSAAYAQQSGQEVLYITERAVFQLTAEGVELIEIARVWRLSATFCRIWLSVHYQAPTPDGK